MYLFIKSKIIAQRCCHQVFSNLKCYPKVLSYEKNLQALSFVQIRSYSQKDDPVNIRSYSQTDDPKSIQSYSKKDDPKSIRSRIKKDDPKNNVELIYHGKLSKNVKYVKILSIGTSIISLAIQPWLLPKVIETGSISAMLMTIVIFGGFAFLSPLALHLITNRYTLDLFYDKQRDVYIVTNYTILANIKMTEFTPNDVTRPNGMQLMTTCIIKKKPIFFDYNEFKGLHHYSRILGYDKPMDYLLNQPAPIHESINASPKNEVKKDV